MAEVQIPLALQPFSGGRASVAAAGRTLRQVFDRLELECPGIREQLVADDDVRPGLAIVVDDEITQQGLAQGVAEDSNILILPALGGGSLHDSGSATRSVMRRGHALRLDEEIARSMTRRVIA